MSELVKSLVAGMIDELTPFRSHAQPPFGYGSDLSCTFDLDASMREVSGTLVLAEALLRRLDCPRGLLPDDAHYGIDLRTAANRGITSSELAALAGRIRNELVKDERVADVRVSVRSENAGQRLIISIVVTPVASSSDFALVLSAENGELLLEEIRA